MNVVRSEQIAVCKISYLSVKTKTTPNPQANHTHEKIPTDQTSSPGGERRIIAQVSCFLEIIGKK